MIPRGIRALIRQLLACRHPIANARYDGEWPADMGFPVRSGCVTCGRCGTSLSVAIKGSVPPHAVGGPRADSVISLLRYPVSLS